MKEKVVYRRPSKKAWETLLALPWPKGQLSNAIKVLSQSPEAPVLAVNVIWSPLRFTAMNRFLRRHNSPFRLRVRLNSKVNDFELRKSTLGGHWSIGREAYLGRLAGLPSDEYCDPKRWPRKK